MSRPPPRETTTWGRTCLAGAAGLVTAVGLTDLIVVIVAVVGERVNHVDDASSLTPVSFMAWVGFLAACECAVIILLVCAPLWWLMRVARWGTWWSAAVLGFVASFAHLIVRHDDDTLTALDERWLWSLAGAAAGWVMWRVAYRKNAANLPS
jgi:hypothetical protein